MKTHLTVQPKELIDQNYLFERDFQHGVSKSPELLSVDMFMSKRNYMCMPLFQVQVGNLNYFIGYLQYRPIDDLKPDKVDYFTIIMVTTSIFFLLVVILWIAITWGSRKVSRAKRRERAGRLIKSVHSSTTNSTG